MGVNNEKNYLLKIRKILKEQHGTLQTAILDDMGIPRTYLSILERRGEIERVSRGVYRATDSIEDELFSFQTRYKSSAFSHETALYLHDLIDRSPLYYSVTVPSGYHSVPLNESQHKVFYLKRSLFDFGIVTMKSPHGNNIRVTDLERTICDVLRNRNQIDVQLLNDALKRYVKDPRRKLNLLNQYANQFGIQNVVKTYMEILL